MCVELPATSYYNNTLSASKAGRWTLCCTFKSMQLLAVIRLIAHNLLLPLISDPDPCQNVTTMERLNYWPPTSFFSAKQYTYFDHQEIWSVTGPVSAWAPSGAPWGSMSSSVFQRNMFSFPDKLFCEWLQRVSPSRYLLPFPYRLFVSHPPTLVPSLPARGICSKTLAHEEREAPQFNWQAPCKAALFHYKLSQQAVRQLSCIIEPTEQQGQARSRACGVVACKSTDHNVVTKRFSPRSSGTAVLQYEVMAESYSTDPKVCDRVFSDEKNWK